MNPELTGLVGFLREATIGKLRIGVQSDFAEKYFGPPEGRNVWGTDGLTLKWQELQLSFERETLFQISVEIIGEPTSIRLRDDILFEIPQHLIPFDAFAGFIEECQLTWHPFVPLTFDDQRCFALASGVHVLFLGEELNKLVTTRLSTPLHDAHL